MFSYLRREHRRSSTSPAVSFSTPFSAKANVSNKHGHASSDSNSSKEAAKGNDNTTFSDGNQLDSTAVASQSSVNCAAPESLFSDRPPSRRSGAKERDTLPTLALQSNRSQPSLMTNLGPQNVETQHNRSLSPLRARSDKEGLDILMSSPDDQTRPASHGETTTRSYSRLNATVEENVKVNMPGTHHAEAKLDKIAGRRRHLTLAERDDPADHGHHKSGKAKFYLLKPMSLLARRRSSQITGLRADDVGIGVHNLVPAIPDDYDPRIRGSIVHDFSTPRPRRNLAISPNSQSGGLSELSDRNFQTEAGSTFSPLSGQQSHISEQKQPKGGHSPVFREHFDDDQNALQVENKGFLQSDLLTRRSPEHEQSIPVFAKRLPPTLPDTTEEVSEQPVLREDNTAPSPDPTKRIPQTGNPDSDTVENLTQPASGLPKHFKSTASRFSFDMNGVESSAQERLLEEKHRAKEAARRAEAQQEDKDLSDFENDFDSDLIDDIDDYEEKIPGVNADADEDQFSNSGGQDARFQQKPLFVPSLSPVPISPASVFVPDELNNLDSGNASRPIAEGNQLDQAASDSLMSNDLDTAHEFSTTPSSQMLQHGHQPSSRTNSHIEDFVTLVDDDDEDDLYFDDGEFVDLPPSTDDAQVDESIFDDENIGFIDLQHPGISNAYIRTGLKGDTGDRRHEASQFFADQMIGSDFTDESTMANNLEDSTRNGRGDITESIPSAKLPGTENRMLSEYNLGLLRNALEKAAATEATSDEGLCSEASVGQRSLYQESVTQTNSTMNPSSEFLPHRMLIRPAEGMSSDGAFDILDYGDDAFYDDPIVAAANAEALENDDEGFYGSEFGFYAQPHFNCNSELTHGGYFGPRGFEGFTCSFSGRGKFCEPSLTPITERSEWSTRNSIVSLSAHGGPHSSVPSAQSPLFAQLLDMASADEEMSLSALMKLRRGAFGGSNGSLRSSAGSSPSAAVPPHCKAPGTVTACGQESKALSLDTRNLNSGNNSHVEGFENSASPQSPRLSMDLSTPDSLHETSKTSKSHSRASSLASVSYIMETNEDGLSKWVMERRRTNDDGETEVLEREVLARGYI